ncbi:hypothetical protein BU15DRAFT_64319 [Melanogaster broomeanus]|nr:hypothetical protein BU15DRAFT_64319 [Melanogaster broomeanus]
MNPQKAPFLQVLQLSPYISDEVLSTLDSSRNTVHECRGRNARSQFPTFISLTAGGKSSLVSLQEIHEAVVQYKCAEYLDPLSILPTLLPCHHDGAMELIATADSAAVRKEVMIVIQEAIEQLQSHFNDEEDETEVPAPDLIQSIRSIVSLCSPGSVTYGWTSYFTVEDKVCSLISSASLRATNDEGRALVTEVARQVKSLADWADALATDDLAQIKALLRELLDTTVVGCASSIQANLAARAAESHFPRFSLRSFVKEGWQEGEKAMLEVQMNLVLDESLFLLFRILTHENMNIPPDDATSLCTRSRWSKRRFWKRLRSLHNLLRSNPFASRELLRVFGAVLFRPNPPEFFSEIKTREELAGSLELLRIGDCLSFYYVLLQRDRENKTEVRSVDNVKSVEGSFLRPLRQFVDEHISGQEQPLMAILSLQVGLDRIHNALRDLHIK